VVQLSVAALDDPTESSRAIRAHPERHHDKLHGPAVTGIDFFGGEANPDLCGVTATRTVSRSTFSRRRWLARRAAGLALLAVCGCGHSAPVSSTTTRHASTSARVTASSAPVTACRPDARTAIAGFLAVAPGSIAVAASTGNNAMPQCSYTVRVPGHRRVQAIANVNTGPQPYFVLERTAIEAAQEFTATRLVAAPEAVTKLGIEADWFPAETQLMATDGLRLITVSISWPHTPQSRQRALAKALTRIYLKPTKRGTTLAKGYP
jgi:hypothetical protein